MNNYLQQSNFRPQVHQVPPYQGAAFRGAPPPPYPNIPQRPSMPAQLGNALTQMMQLKGMRAQNKLAEFQMQQAKAAQEQQIAQQQALQKTFADFGDPNIAELGQYAPQIALKLMEMKQNLNQVDPTVIENNIKMSSMIDEAIAGGVTTYSTLQQLVPHLREKRYDPQVIAQIDQTNKPYLAAWKDIQTAKNKPKYTLMNNDGSIQIVEATTIAQKNKFDAMVNAGTARYGEYKAEDKPTTTERERTIQWHMDQGLSRTQAVKKTDEEEAATARATRAPKDESELGKTMNALEAVVKKEPEYANASEDEIRVEAARRNSAMNRMQVNIGGQTPAQLVNLAQDFYKAQDAGQAVLAEYIKGQLAIAGVNVGEIRKRPKTLQEFWEVIVGAMSDRATGFISGSPQVTQPPLAGGTPGNLNWTDEYVGP